jgi:Cation efflux family
MEGRLVSAHDRGGHDHDHTSHGFRALAINSAIFVIELAGALYAGSLTLLADAVHMLTDSASLGLALFAAWVATRPADAKRTYGYQRTEVLGALANGLLLLVTVGFIVYEAIGRFRDPPAVQPEVVIIVGVVGLLANLAAAYVLMGDRENLNSGGRSFIWWPTPAAARHRLRRDRTAVHRLPDHRPAVRPADLGGDPLLDPGAARRQPEHPAAGHAGRPRSRGDPRVPRGSRRRV